MVRLTAVTTNPHDSPQSHEDTRGPAPSLPRPRRAHSCTPLGSRNPIINDRGTAIPTGPLGKGLGGDSGQGRRCLAGTSTLLGSPEGPQALSEVSKDVAFHGPIDASPHPASQGRFAGRAAGVSVFTAWPRSQQSFRREVLLSAFSLISTPTETSGPGNKMQDVTKARDQTSEQTWMAMPPTSTEVGLVRTMIPPSTSWVFQALNEAVRA